MITKAQALTEQTFHYGECVRHVGPRGGKETKIEQWRRSGKTQVWKTRPNEFRVPIKFGLYGYGAITHSNADGFHVAGECPLNMADNPQANVTAVFKAWFARKENRRYESVWTNGDTIYSYQTWMVTRARTMEGGVIGGDVLLNKTKYSQTTTKIQNGLRELLNGNQISFTETAVSGSGNAIRRGSLSPYDNPSLAVFGNPKGSRVLSKDVCEIRYRHIEDGKYYKHKFKKGQVQVTGEAGGKVATLRRVDGKPLLGEY